MSEHPKHAAAGPGHPEEGAPEPVRVTDKRRIDPTTGELRRPTAEDVAAGQAGQQAGTEGAQAAPQAGGAPDDALAAAEALAAERLADLQRLQAEFVNYKRRVERDRSLSAELAVAGVVEALMPVLDEIELARQHGELESGPFASIAEKLETTLGRFGWERYGAAGEPFDPAVHEALMHAESDDVSEPTVSQVVQPGHRVGERIVRPARVGVTAPPS